MKLYSYWRSTAAYRVRIALNLKGLEYETVSVNLVKEGGEHRKDDYARVNPQRLVPALVDRSATIGQSAAILEYLEEKYPNPALLPGDIQARAFARQIAQIITCDIHPLNNIGVLLYLSNEIGISEEAKSHWYHHWVKRGFDAMERLLTDRGWKGPYCLGNSVTLADICVVPQMYNAHRFQVPVDDYPTLCSIEQACLKLEPFIRALPDNQPDAPKL